MTLPVVQATNTSVQGTAGSSHPVSLPASIAAGDLLIILFANVGSGVAPTVSTPSGWSALGSVSDGNQLRQTIFYKIASGSEGASVTITTSGGNCRSAHNTFRITEFDPATAPAVGSTVAATTANPDPPSLNPAGWGTEDTLWMAIASSRGVAATGWPSTFTDNQLACASAGATPAAQASAVLRANAASEDPGTFTLPASDETIAQTLAVRPLIPPSPLTAVGAIATAEALGTVAVSPGPVAVTGVGAIATAEAFGLAFVTVPQLLSLAGIATAEAVGLVAVAAGPVALAAVGGIASAEALGQAVVGYAQALAALGIASAEALGLAAVLKAPWPVTGVGGIATAEALGVPSLTRWAVPPPVFHIYIDWDNDGSFATAGDEVTPYLMSTAGAGWDRGRSADFSADSVGQATFVLRNTDGRFSPANAPGLIPGTPVFVKSVYAGVEKPHFFGFIQRVSPEPWAWTVTITAYDPRGAMARKTATLPVRSRTHREIRLDALNAFGAAWRNLFEVNPSFESSTTGWSVAGGTLTRIAGDAAPTTNAGTACAEASNAVGGTTITSLTVPVVLPPDGTIRISFWAKSISGAASMDVAGYGASNSALISNPVVRTMTASWARYTAVLTARTVWTDVTIRLLVSGNAVFRLDAVQLTLGPEERDFVTGAGAVGTLEQNYLDDPSFETKPASANWADLRTNLVTNPSFETNTSGWSVAGDAFTAASASITRSTAQAKHGSASGLVAPTGGNSGVFFPITGTFKGGVAYSISMWMRTVTPASPAMKYGIGSQGTPADFAQATTSSDNDTAWQEHTVTWTPSSNRTDVHVYASLNASGSSPSFYIDSVMVTEGTSVPVFVDPFGLGVEASSATRVTTDASSGSASMEVVTTATNLSGMRYKGLGSQRFFAGVAYTFVCSVKSVSGNTALAIGIGSESASSDSAVTTFAATGDYVAQSVTWTPASDRVDVIAFVRMQSGAAAATFRVDGCALYPGSTVFAFEPVFADLAVEDGRAPDYASSGSIKAVLDSVNEVTLSRHWVEPTLTAPFWIYRSRSLADLAAKTVDEVFDNDFADLTNFQTDDDAVINVQKVESGLKYIDTVGVTQTSSSTSVAWASDAVSAARGRRDGQVVSSNMLENDLTVLQDLADAIVTRYKDTRERPTLTARNRYTSAVAREVDDLIEVTLDRLDIVSRKYLVVKITQKVTMGIVWESTYVLEEFPY